MKNPNGYGSVVKLSGNRRKPYCARKTSGWNDKGYPIYSVIGYYANRGYTEHDEKQVDELANALYMVIQDNKSLFSVT